MPLILLIDSASRWNTCCPVEEPGPWDCSGGRPGESTRGRRKMNTRQCSRKVPKVPTQLVELFCAAVYHHKYMCDVDDIYQEHEG